MNASCDIASDDAGESVTYRYASAKGQEKRNQGITRKNLMMIWMEAELEFYREASSNDASEYTPWMSDNKKKPRDPPVTHLEAAASEFAKRFPFRSVEDDEEDMNDDISSESPFLLVATNISDNWRVPDMFKDCHAVRFMLVPGEAKNASILFINYRRGTAHGSFDAKIIYDIEKWIINEDLEDVLSHVTGGKGGEYQPDDVYQPTVPDCVDPKQDANDRREGYPYARLVVEVE